MTFLTEFCFQQPLSKKIFKQNFYKTQLRTFSTFSSLIPTLPITYLWLAQLCHQNSGCISINIWRCLCNLANVCACMYERRPNFGADFLFCLQTSTEERLATGSTVYVYRDMCTLPLYTSITGPSKVCAPAQLLRRY